MTLSCFEKYVGVLGPLEWCSSEEDCASCHKEIIEASKAMNNTSKNHAWHCNGIYGTMYLGLVSLGPWA